MNEVYEGDVNGFVKPGDEFFSLMPNSATTVELSEQLAIVTSEGDRLTIPCSLPLARGGQSEAEQEGLYPVID